MNYKEKLRWLAENWNGEYDNESNINHQISNNNLTKHISLSEILNECHNLKVKSQHTIIIDGKEITISEESYNELKRSLK
jgi:hypothetical protein